MKFSRAFGLNQAQAALDFVDIDTNIDMPLYFDPYVFEAEDDPFAVECNRTIVSFFQRVLHSVRMGEEVAGKTLLGRLSEPNEICFGVSSNRPEGRGIGTEQAEQIYEQLAASAAAQSGLLSDLAKCELFVEGIGPDKISDICANIIRHLLVEYTQEQCQLHGITDLSDYPIGPTWDIQQARWVERYHRLPSIDHIPVILVPKRYVRWQGDLSHQHRQYYRHYVLNFLQNKHLAAGDALVTVLQNGGRKVYKKTLMEQPQYELSKDFLFRFSRDNPAILQRYVSANSSKNPPSQTSLEEDFNEEQFVESLKDELANIDAGNADASKYEKLMPYVLEYIFYPNLTYPKLQARIHGGRKIIDIVYANSAQNGFFRRLSQQHQIPSTYIVVECKNYSSDPANPELDQLIGRFDVNRGRFGILCARTFDNKQLFINRCKDTAHAGNGWIIPLVDDDILRMLDWCKLQERSRVNAYLEELLWAVLS